MRECLIGTIYVVNPTEPGAAKVGLNEDFSAEFGLASSGFLEILQLSFEA